MSLYVDCGTAPTVNLAAPQPLPAVEVLDPLQISNWDYLLFEQEEATAFHTAGWARVLAETYGFQPFYLAQRAEGRLLSLWPLMETGGRWRGYRGTGLPFTDACPPLFSQRSPEAHLPVSHTDRTAPAHSEAMPAPLDRVAAQEPLLAAGLSLARSRNWRSLELRDCPRWTTGTPASVSYYGHTIDLRANEGALFARCSSPARRAVRKANRSLLRLSEGSELSDVKAYFELHCQTRRRHGVPPQPFAFFRNLHRHLIEPGAGFVLLARRGDTPVAGAIFLLHGRRAIYKFGASDEAHWGNRPNNLIFWDATRRCAARGCTHLDLGKTSLDNEGLRGFKLGLGSNERLIHYHQFLQTGQIQKRPDPMNGWPSRLLRLLPPDLNRLVGAVLYRYAS